MQDIHARDRMSITFSSTIMEGIEGSVTQAYSKRRYKEATDPSGHPDISRTKHRPADLIRPRITGDIRSHTQGH